MGDAAFQNSCTLVCIPGTLVYFFRGRKPPAERSARYAREQYALLARRPHARPVYAHASIRGRVFRCARKIH